MLAVMSIPIPLFAMEYCLTLGGPVGVLLGPAAAFQTVFVVSVILALLGQGGLTVVGLNALVLGAGAALARPVYLALRRRASAPAALARVSDARSTTPPAIATSTSSNSTPTTATAACPRSEGRSVIGPACRRRPSRRAHVLRWKGAGA